MRKLILIILLLIPGFAICQTSGVKWEEKFNDKDIFDRGWKYVNRDSSAHVASVISPHEYVLLGTQNAQSGLYYWRFNFEDANAKRLIDDWLITPRLENIVVGDSISFWCGAIDRNFKDTLQVWVSTGDNSPENFIMIDRFKVDGPVGTWHKKTYDLSKYSGSNVYLGVQYTQIDGGTLGISSDHVWVDNFTLTGPGGGSETVTSYELQQNFPNPFNPGTEIKFSILENTNVSLKIYNSAGEQVAVLVNDFMTAGKYSINFDGSGLSSGVYFYKLSAGSFSDTKKMTLVK